MAEKVTRLPEEISVTEGNGVVVIATTNTTVAKETFIGDLKDAKKTLLWRRDANALMSVGGLAGVFLSAAFAISGLADMQKPYYDYHDPQAGQILAEARVRYENGVRALISGISLATAAGSISILTANNVRTSNRKIQKIS